MKSLRILAGLGLVVMQAFAGDALAKRLPDGGVTVDEVIAVMQAKGLPTKLIPGPEGTQKIESLYNGTTFFVYFYTCKTERCAAIQFSAGFDLDAGTTCTSIDTWNRKWRYGRAWLDSESDPYVQMDIDVERGSSTESIDNNLETWYAVLDEFTKHIQQTVV